MNIVNSWGLIKRIKKRTPLKPLPSCLCVGDTLIYDLRALGSGIYKPAVTKAGRLSLKGKMAQNKTVKIYSAYGANQVSLRTELNALGIELPICFPAVLKSDNFLIVEEWVNGTPLSDLPRAKAMSYAPQVEAFLNLCQSSTLLTDLAEKHKSAFCYLTDYLILRLEIWRQWQPVKKLVDEWTQEKNNSAFSMPMYLSHPDLTLSNLIVENSTGKLHVVDNELLGVGYGWVIDGRNSFCKEKFSHESLAPSARRFAALSWKLRLVSSALESGDFERAERLASFG